MMCNLQILCFIGVFSLLPFFGCAAKAVDKNSLEDLPEGVKYYPEKIRVDTTFSEPFKKEEDFFQVIRLVRTSNQGIVVPLFSAKRQTRSGFAGRIVPKLKWEDTRWALGNNPAYFYLPSSKDIKAHIFLICPSVEGAEIPGLSDKSWHIWEFKSSEITKKEKEKYSSLNLPLLSKMKPLSEHKEAKQIKELVENAEKKCKKFGLRVGE